MPVRARLFALAQKLRLDCKDSPAAASIGQRAAAWGSRLDNVTHPPRGGLGAKEILMKTVRTTHRVLSILLAATVAISLAACKTKSSKPAGVKEQVTPAAEPASVGGSWSIHEEVDASDCGKGSYDDDYQIDIAQSADEITVTTSIDEFPYGAEFLGTVDGNHLQWNGEYPQDGGTVSVDHLSLTVDGDILSGTESWTWSDGASSCQGTTQVRGERPPTGGVGNSDSPDEAPAFAGFDLTLQEGTFWEFGYHKKFSEWAQGDGGKSGATGGVFRVILGKAETIDGQTLYHLNVIHTKGSESDIPLRWKFIGIAGDTLLGSRDGKTVKTVFDPAKGSQVGGGFFADFGSSSLVQATEGSVHNDYVSGPAVLLKKSYEENSCEFFSGVGQVCGGDRDINTTTQEYFKPGVGPYAYHYSNSFSFNGGGFSSGGSTEWDIGLLQYSSSGDGFYLSPTVSPLGDGDVAIYYGIYGPDTSFVEADPYNAATPVRGASVLMRYVVGAADGEAISPAVPAEAETSYALRTDAGHLLILRRGTNFRTYGQTYDPVSHLPLASEEKRIFDYYTQSKEWLSVDAFTQFDEKYRYFFISGLFASSDGMVPVWEQPVGSGTDEAKQGGNFSWRHLFSVGTNLYAGVYENNVQLSTGPMDIYYLVRLDPVDNDVSEAIKSFGLDVADPARSMRDFAVDATAFYWSTADFATGEAAIWRSVMGADMAEKIWSTTVVGNKPRVMIDADDGYLVINVVTESPLVSTTYLYDSAKDQVTPLTLPGEGVKMNVEIAVAGQSR